MKIIDTKELPMPGVHILSFARFSDDRGYFTESFRKSQFLEEVPFLKGADIVQVNESFSKAGVIRGLHFQWNPYMGKLVRTVHGRMVDIFLDIRKGSPTYGRASMYDMRKESGDKSAEWLWIPPGFAHGNYFTEETVIEYFCTGEYSPGCEAGISPFSSDIDWSMCNSTLKMEFDSIRKGGCLITDKDRDAVNMAQWTKDTRSDNFLFEELK